MSDCHYLEPKGKSREALIRHFPLGIAWDAFRTPGKTAFKWLSALSEGYERAWEALCRLARELNPYTTKQMIGEWEESVSLPDKCLPKATTLQERRDWVVWRLTKRRWTTVAEWKELAALFGLEILVVPGWLVQKPALYPFEYPKRYDLFPKLGRFRVYINIKGVDFGGYDYGIRGDGYPIPYGIADPADVSAFQCIIERVKPAHVVIIWNGLTSAIYPAEKLLYDLPDGLPEAEADGIIEDDLSVGLESVITEQSVVVRLAFGTPSSATEAEMLDGDNVAAIKDVSTGKWEVIQFRDAEKLPGNRYKLTGLIRAQIGTDGAMRAQHPAESRFTLFGQTSQSHEDKIRAGLNIAQVPFSPVHVEADQDAGTSDITLTWVRRTRAHYIAIDNFDEETAPLGEATEAYEVEIMDGVNPARTLSVSSETATYTAAQQTEDFGAPVSSLTVRVRQIGDNGPGTYREASFTF